jgi:hypothetical protein
MIEALSSKVEGDYLMIVAAGKIVSNEEYRLLLKRYCDEIVQSGLKKIIIDETNVDYAQSFFLQIDIVEFYSSGELPEEFSTWKIACVGREDMSAFSDFWVDVAQRSGYDHHGFSSIELAREFLSK